MTEIRAQAEGRRGWLRVALTLLAVKLAYGLVVWGMTWWGEAFDAERAEYIRREWFPAQAPPPVHGRWERHFATWDAEHYLYLSTHGYGPEVRSIAFYPLWPLLMRAATPLAGGNPVVAGMALANLFSLAGWVLFHRAAARRFGEAVADWSLALLVAFPGALFFQFIYSEPLFFLLVAGLWWGLERRRRGVAAIAGFLLPLTRGVGVFAVLPVGWAVLASRDWRWLRRGREDRVPQGRTAENQNRQIQARPVAAKDPGPTGLGPLEPRPAGRESTAIPWVLPVAPMLGWATYLALLWHWTGNPWAGIEAQKFWGVHALSHLWDVPRFVKGFFEVTAWHAYTGSMLDRLGFVLVLYALPVLWTHGRDLLAWTLMLAVIPAMSGTFTSFVRFESCAFPVFLAAGLWLNAGPGAAHGAESAPPLDDAVDLRRRNFSPKRWLGWGLLAVFAGLHVHLLWRFLNYHWAG